MRRGKGAIVVADANASERQGLVQKFSEQDQDVAVLEAPSADLLRTILAEQPVDMLLISEQFSNNSGLDILEQLGPLVQGVITILMDEYFSRDTLAQASRTNLYDCIQTPLKEADVVRLLKRRDAQKTRLSALVVDSQPAARHIIFKLLSDSRFDLMTSEAESGPLAVSLCKSIPYQILLVDPATKDWRGAGMVKHITDRQALCRIVLMSANDKESLQDQYHDVNISGFLKKPFYARDLDRVLHQLMKVPVSNLLKDDFYETQSPLSGSSLSGKSRNRAPDGGREIVWL
ncbi:response regulator [uncultured Cohaesibacter sp.]|uniref:response regulator n=1 Tax=uncultured Cohaesibacter sp. TaxID=1002546 RepID=UPI002AAAFC25|nr:response regulator [uncultured Cohaesibacter sp.]